MARKGTCANVLSLTAAGKSSEHYSALPCTADVLLFQLQVVFLFCVPISHGGNCLRRASGEKLTLNISLQFMTHDVLTLMAFNELRD